MCAREGDSKRRRDRREGCREDDRERARACKRGRE